MDNNNPKPEIEKILRTCLENLRELAHTPSKPHPPDQKLCEPSEPLVKTTVLSGLWDWAREPWQESSLDEGSNAL